MAARRLGTALVSIAYFALSCSPAAAVVGSLPLSLKLWTMSETKTIVCTGKSWVSLAAGTMQRNAVIVVLADSNESHNDSLLACDDGAGADAPITGDRTAARPVTAGQTVLKGTLDVIFLNVPAGNGTHSSIAFTTNTLDGEAAFVSKSGKGMIRIVHAKGIDVYPPSFAIASVDESTTYRLQGPAPAPAPCVINYYTDNPNVPQKVIQSKLDCCPTLLHQVGVDGIFSASNP